MVAARGTNCLWEVRGQMRCWVMCFDLSKIRHFSAWWRLPSKQEILFEKLQLFVVPFNGKYYTLKSCRNSWQFIGLGTVLYGAAHSQNVAQFYTQCLRRRPILVSNFEKKKPSINCFFCFHLATSSLMLLRFDTTQTLSAGIGQSLFFFSSGCNPKLHLSLFLARSQLSDRLFFAPYHSLISH